MFVSWLNASVNAVLTAAASDAWIAFRSLSSTLVECLFHSYLFHTYLCTPVSCTPFS